MDKNTEYEFFLINFFLMIQNYVKKTLKKHSLFEISFLIFGNKSIFLSTNLKEINNTILNSTNYYTKLKAFYNNYKKKYNTKKKLTDISSDADLTDLIIAPYTATSFFRKHSIQVYNIKIAQKFSLMFILGLSKNINKEILKKIVNKFNLIESILRSVNNSLINDLPLIEIVKNLKFTSFFLISNNNKVITFFTPDILFKKIKKGENIKQIFKIKEITPQKRTNRYTSNDIILYYKNFLYNNITMIEIILEKKLYLSPKLLILKNNFFTKKEQLISEIFSILYNKKKSYSKKFYEILKKIRIFFDADYVFLSYPLTNYDDKNLISDEKLSKNMWEDFKDNKIKRDFKNNQKKLDNNSFKNINSIVFKSNNPVFVESDNSVFKKDNGFKILKIKSQITVKIKPENDIPWLFGLCYIGEKVYLGPYDKKLFNSLALIIGHFLELMIYNESNKEQISNYENLFTSIPLPTIVIDSNFNIIKYNKFFLKFFNIDTEKIKTKTIFDFITFFYIRKNYYHLSIDKLVKLFNEKKYENNNFKQFIDNYNIRKARFLSKISKDGKDDFFIFEIYKKKIISELNIQYILIFYDLTEKLETIKKFSEIDKIQTLGNITATVAHEFNNLLTGITGNIELIKALFEELKNGNLKLNEYSDNLMESLNDMKYVTGKAQKLTTNLLGYSKKRPSEIKTIELNDFLNKEIKIIKNLLGERINITFEESKEPIYIKIDENGLSHLIMNLCINAKDAMNGKGTIAININKIKITKDKFHEIENKYLNKKMVTIEVKDTGTGIPKNYLEKIFNPFFTTKGESKGTGLGLSFVKGFVEQHKGFIKVYSQEGVGTTFKIFFYIVDKEKKDLRDEKNLEKNEENLSYYINFIKKRVKKILIVEDDKIILKYLRKILQNIEIEIIEAKSLQEALHLFSIYFNNIDFIISDVVLKQDSGYDLYKKIMLTKDVPWLFISGYPLDMLNKWNYLKQDINLLQKPFEFPDLIKYIYKILVSI